MQSESTLSSISNRKNPASNSLPIRARLTIWYVLVLATGLILFVAATSFVLYWQLSRQLTRFAIQDIENIEGLLFFGKDGSVQLNEDYHNHPESRKILEHRLQVLSPEGATIYRNWRLGSDVLGGAPFPGEGENGYSPRTIRMKNGISFLVVSRRHILANRPLIIRLGFPQDEVSSQVREFVTASATTLPILLAIAAFLGIHLARRSLAPMADMARLAEQITAEDLHKRLPVTNPDDEVGQLGRVVNDLLDRLEQAFAQLRRFTSDASHELRTPLAAIRSVGEVSLQFNKTAEEYRDTIGSMLEEVTRLTHLVESLLTMSRADAGQIKLNYSIVSAEELVKEVVGVIGVLAEERNQEISVYGDPTLAIQADRVLLRQALVNVLHNATKYSPVGGRISVSVTSPEPEWVSVRIADTGPGISPEHRDKIFRRFYRIDESRASEMGGAGLGLAIAKWCIEMHEGTITVGDMDEGSVFEILLPRSG